jgi:hypothetical protein
LGKEYRITSISPREFTVEIDGPAAALREVRGNILTPRLEFSGRSLEDGRQNFPITNTVLGLEPDMRIESINPASVEDISVQIGKEVTAELFVVPPTPVDVPEGVEPTISLEQGKVMVRGPESTVAELASHKQLSFAPLSLAGAAVDIAKPETVRLRLEAIAPDTVKVSEVYALVTFKPIDGEKRQVSLPIHFLVDAEFLVKHRVALSQQQVVVTMRGPKNLLEGLAPDHVSAYVNLRRPLELNQAREVPVEFVAPLWLTVEPTTVRVTLSLAPTVAPSSLDAP